MLPKNNVPTNRNAPASSQQTNTIVPTDGNADVEKKNSNDETGNGGSVQKDHTDPSVKAEKAGYVDATVQNSPNVDEIFRTSAMDHFQELHGVVKCHRINGRHLKHLTSEGPFSSVTVGIYDQVSTDFAGNPRKDRDIAMCKALCDYKDCLEKKWNDKVQKKNKSADPVDSNAKESEDCSYTEECDEGWEPEHPNMNPTMPNVSPTSGNDTVVGKYEMEPEEKEEMAKFCCQLDLCFPMFVAQHVQYGSDGQQENKNKFMHWCPCGMGGKWWRITCLDVHDTGDYAFNNKDDDGCQRSNPDFGKNARGSDGTPERHAWPAS
jgi:hypothetical protein